MADLRSRLAAALAGRYEIEGEIGHGGMATVFRARDLRHGRVVAVKVLKPELAAALGGERFLREIRVAANLSHPNVLPLHDSGEHEGLLYYVMPFIEGESLAQRLLREGQLGIEDALRITRQVAAALHHAHQQGVIHRDIKPGNILLSPEGAFVADFGIAQAMEETGGQRLTSTGIVIGTPSYMSPEQSTGAARLDGRADVYSLGCVLYEMLVGEPPFSGPTPRSILARHSLERVPGLRTVRDTVPVAVEAAVLRALAKLPADRFASAAEFAQALEPERLSREFTAPTAAGAATGEVQRVAPWWAWGRRRGAILTIAALVVLGGAIVAALQLRPAGGRAPAADPEAIAVLPLRPGTNNPTLARLGEELADQLALRFPGGGGPRAVAPANLRAARLRLGIADDAELSDARAVAIARAAGASTLVLGQVWLTAGRLVLSASIQRLDGSNLARVPEISGSADSTPALLDRLAAALLAAGMPGSPTRQAELAELPLPALRAFLAGDRAVSAGRFTAAADFYAAVLRLRPGEPQAALALAGVAQFLPDSPATHAITEALRLAPRYDAADRAFLRAAAGPAWPLPSSRAERISAWEAAVAEAPDRPDRWYYLGEMLFHYGPWLAMPGVLDRAGAAYRRAFDLDEAFIPALGHLIDLAASAGDTASVRALGARYAALDSNGELAGYYRWRVAVALDDRAALKRLRARIDSMGPTALERMVNVSQLDGVALDDALHAAAALWSQSGLAGDTRWAFTKRRELALNRGRPREAVTITRERTAATSLRARDRLAEVVEALTWGADTTAAAAVARAQAATVDRPPARMPPGDADYYLDLCGVALWRVAHGDTAGVARAILLLRSAPPPTVGTETPHLELCAQSLAARLTAHTGSPAAQAELARLDSLAGTAPSVITWMLTEANLTAARLWESAGDRDRALAAVRRRSYITDAGEPRVLVALSTMLREEGRLSAATGDGAAARRAWRRYLALRQSPEPEVLPEVRAVRAALDSLERDAATASRE